MDAVNINEWAQVVPYIFGFLAVAVAGWVAHSIDRMSKSVENLNVQIAVVITNIGDHERRLEKLENRKP